MQSGWNVWEGRVTLIWGVELCDRRIKFREGRTLHYYWPPLDENTQEPTNKQSVGGGGL
jgi:hypothetical protein